ncbi:MAG: NAD(P) transhydrogenase subunit alpha [Eubacteriales bacterium]|nr:NAD(P) transhydrogenase subunit alpha [Eubacteriales bacterium]
MTGLEGVLVLVFLVAAVLGYKLIKAVPSLLHTPLMSGMNALSGITILGMITVTAFSQSVLARLVGMLGIIAAVINVVAGFGVTDRMLRMFKGGKEAVGKGS